MNFKKFAFSSLIAALSYEATAIEQNKKCSSKPTSANQKSAKSLVDKSEIDINDHFEKLIDLLRKDRIPRTVPCSTDPR